MSEHHVMLAVIMGLRDEQRPLGLGMEHDLAKLVALFRKFDTEGMPLQRAT